MRDETRTVTTRRSLLGKIAVGAAALGGGVGKGAAGTSQCTFDGGCYVTKYDGVRIYQECPSGGDPHVGYLDKGRGGFMVDTCGCYVKLEFDCEESWWLSASDLELDMNHPTCFC